MVAILSVEIIGRCAENISQIVFDSWSSGSRGNPIRRGDYIGNINASSQCGWRTRTKRGSKGCVIRVRIVVVQRGDTRHIQ